MIAVAAVVAAAFPLYIIVLLLLLRCSTMLCSDNAIAAATIEPYHGIDLICFDQLLYSMHRCNKKGAAQSKEEEEES